MLFMIGRYSDQWPHSMMAETTLEVDNCNNSPEYTGRKDNVISKYITPVVKVVLEEIIDSVANQLSIINHRLSCLVYDFIRV